MRTYLMAFLGAFGVAAVLTPVLCALAEQVGGIDHAASSRKLHTEPTPRIGGIAIVLGFFAPLVGLFFWENSVSTTLLAEPGRVAGLFAGGIAIAALGLWDDLLGVGPRTKLLAQIVIAAVLFQLGYRIEAVSNPFGGGSIALGPLAWPVTVAWLVGIINALNLIDGLDGLAGGVAVIVVGLTFGMAASHGDVLMCLLMAALGGGVVGFLFYNLSPASIFMGDTGSMFLGFVLAAASVATSQKNSTAVALVVPIVALGLPITDVFLAMARRALAGRPMFSADREHIHHRLLSLGLSSTQTVLVLYGVCATLAAAAVLLASGRTRVSAVTLVVLAVAVAAGLVRLGYLRLGGLGVRDLRAVRQRTRDLHRTVQGGLGALLATRELDDLRVTLAPFGLAVGARSVAVRLAAAGEAAHRELGWYRVGREAEAPRPLREMRRSLVLGSGRRPVGELIVVLPAADGSDGHNLELAVDRAAQDLVATLARLVARAPGACVAAPAGTLAPSSPG